MLMVGVSTAQNITNLVAAVTKGQELDKFLLLETATAKRNKWSDGLIKVLANRRISVERLDLSGIDSNIVEIRNVVLEKVREHLEPIVWNLGGGQKPQQIPLWEIFRLRNEIGIRDSVCYANQDNRQHSVLEIWEFDRQGQLFKRERDIEVDLTADEIFRVFNFIVKRSTPIYANGSSGVLSEIVDLMRFKEFRTYLLELAKLPGNPDVWAEVFNLETIANRLKQKEKDVELAIAALVNRGTEKDLSNPNNVKALSDKIRALLVGNKDQRSASIVDWLKSKPIPKVLAVENAELRDQLNLNEGEIGIEIDPSLLESIAPGNSKPSTYFESVVVQRICDLLSTQNHSVTGAYANLEIARSDNESTVTAEYDVLLVTNRGTIIALDAKTFDFQNKDIDARLYNLEQGSGYYRTFSPVIPLDYDDVDGRDPPKELISLAFRLQRKRMGFYVISDTTSNSSYWIRFNAETNLIEKTTQKPDANGWIECQPLAQAIP